jgi:CheY-like chemotaxis protein
MVMLTSLGLRGDASKMEKIGYAAYMAKPVRRSQFFDCLAMVVGRKLEDPDHAKPGLVTQHALSENKHRRAHILIVEDNSINQKLALKMVEHFGYTAQGCENGAEAIQALEKSDFDLVLMDVQMPEMDGFEATRLIRDPASKVRNHKIGIIAMTAHAMKGDKEHCLAVGMDGYICKPIQPQELANAIEKLLSRMETHK